MSKELTTTNDKFMVPAANDMSAVLEDMQSEMEGLQLTFDRIKIPAGGGLAFEVPNGNPDAPDMLKEIVGVIVDHHPINAYWEDKYNGQNNPPTCSSMDGKQGINITTGEIRACKNCPYNQFGSDGTGKGKACKNMHRIYILRSGDTFPLLLTLPPTSLKAFSDYIGKRLLVKGYKSCDVVTKITLKRVQNSSGIAYSQAQFSLESVLDAETKAVMRQYAESIKAVTRQQGSIDTSDYDGYVSAEAASINETIPF